MSNNIADHQNNSLIDTESENLPKYCEYFKFFLVEELVLENNYSELHYGKCSLIGKLREDQEGNFLLENIKLQNLPSEYSLPEGTVALRLLRFNYFGTKLQHGRFCEVCGEVVLLDTKQPSKNKVPHTSRWVCERLQSLGANKQAKDNFLTQLLETHKPALKLWLLDEIKRAGELAERNLEIRMLCKR